jgi:predicted nucleotidyltransferase
MAGTPAGAAALASTGPGVTDRLRRTVEVFERRGYALPPGRLAALCLGGPVDLVEVERAVAEAPDLRLASGLVVSERASQRAPAIAARARRHPGVAAAYLPSTLAFVRALTALDGRVLCVAIAGSLASGGFTETDDVDLNLVVEDGHRHVAYVLLNLLGYLHALRHRRKPVDSHTRRPLAPRLMTANLVLERSQCFPLERQDEGMACELLQSEPVFGAAFFQQVVEANPALVGHFPQLARRPAPRELPAGRRLPGWLWPALLDGPCRELGRAAWRYLQWTRRGSPEALQRVAFVRRTMQPYTLFPDL